MCGSGGGQRVREGEKEFVKNKVSVDLEREFLEIKVQLEAKVCMMDNVYKLN